MAAKKKEEEQEENCQNTLIRRGTATTKARGREGLEVIASPVLSAESAGR